MSTLLFQMDKFEIDACLKWIEEKNLTIVALQLPDEDLDKVQDLIDALTSSNHNDEHRSLSRRRRMLTVLATI